MKNTSENPTQGPASDHYEGRYNGMTFYEQAFGTYETMIFCEINALKYRIRLGKKSDQPIEKELAKANWYEAEAKRLKSKLGTPGEVLSADRLQAHSLVTVSAADLRKIVLPADSVERGAPFDEDFGEEAVGCRKPASKPKSPRVYTSREIVEASMEDLDFTYRGAFTAEEVKWRRPHQTSPKKDWIVYFSESRNIIELYLDTTEMFSIEMPKTEEELTERILEEFKK